MAQRSSLRRQLIAWNTLTLAVLLGILGLATHFASYTYALHSVDTELGDRVHPPPHGGPPRGGGPDEDHGPRGPGGPGGPDGPDFRGPGPGGPDDGGPGRDGPGRPGGPRNDMFGLGPGRPPGPGGDDQRPRVFSVDGKPLQPWNTSKPWDAAALTLATSESPLFTTVTVEGDPYRVVSRAIGPGPGQGPQVVVQAAYPLADLNRATDALDRGLLALIPIGGLGAWIGATFLTRRVLGRVSRFSHAAERMGEDDLSRRLPVDGNDEFADLANTFNGLLARLQQAFVRQASALEQQRRFTADASHELKTPLTVIKGTTSMALANSKLDPSVAAAFGDINFAADGMVKLVQDLLYLARADAGSLGTERQEILSLEVLERAAGSVAHVAGGQIQFSKIDPVATFWGNEQELIRLFTNLLSNARQHTSETGVVRISTSVSKGVTEVVIADNGAGVAAEHVAKLGQRFFRADQSRSREDGGTGLGLAIASEIVRAHAGTIQFESVLGKGTSVKVRIPSTDAVAL